MVLEVSQTGIFGTLLAVLESLEVDSFLKKGDEKETHHSDRLIEPRNISNCSLLVGSRKGPFLGRLWVKTWSGYNWKSF